MTARTKAPARRFAEGTTVKPERSRDELEKLLRRAGAESVAAGYDPARVWVVFRLSGASFRLSFALPPESDFARTPGRSYQPRTAKQRTAARDAEVRRRWRVLVLSTKAKLEVIASGDSSPQREFLADLLLDGGRTVGDAYALGLLPPALPPAR